MDPIAETIITILGEEIARRVLRPPSEALAQPPDEAFRQGASGCQEITVHFDQLQGPPCDVVDALFEERLVDRLLDYGDECGCHK